MFLGQERIACVGGRDRPSPGAPHMATWPFARLRIERIRGLIWALAVAGLVACVAVASQLDRGVARLSPPTRAKFQSLSPPGLPFVSPSAQASLSNAVGAALPRYWTHAAAGGLSASADGLRSTFTPSGVFVYAGGARIGLAVVGVGSAAAQSSPGSAAPRAHLNHVTYPLPGLAVRYSNGPAGLEQSFTVTRTLGGPADRPLTIALGLSGNTHAVVAASGRSIQFEHGDTAVISYTGLSAKDAHGRVLHSWMSLLDRRILLHVDTSGAAFPLRIDPTLRQLGKVMTGGKEEVGNGWFGFRVALSKPGTTALIGAPRDNGEKGTVWVFVRSGETWTVKARLVGGAEEAGAGKFGWSVALNAAGNTALVGARSDHSGVGAAWVFTRSGEAWAQQGPKLVPTEEIGPAEFGGVVALETGTKPATALIGGPEDAGGIGAAWAFTFTGGKWTQSQKLTGAGEAAGAGHFGFAVALSGDEAIVSAVSDNGGNGAVWFYSDSTPGTFAGIGGKVTPPAGSETPGGAFGHSVALGFEGAVIGANLNNHEEGAAYVEYRGTHFANSGEAPSFVYGSMSRLIPSGEVGPGEFGAAVAVEGYGQGSRVLVGAPGDSGEKGAVWDFAESSKGGWEGTKFTPEESASVIGQPQFGQAVALGDINEPLVGGYLNATEVGAAWAFLELGPVELFQGFYGNPRTSSTESTFEILAEAQSPEKPTCKVEWGPVGAALSNEVSCESLGMATWGEGFRAVISPPEPKTVKEYHVRICFANFASHVCSNVEKVTLATKSASATVPGGSSGSATASVPNVTGTISCGATSCSGSTTLVVSTQGSAVAGTLTSYSNGSSTPSVEGSLSLSSPASPNAQVISVVGCLGADSLSQALNSSGGAITSLAVNAIGAGGAIPAHSKLLLVEGAHTQEWEATAEAAEGATTIAVASQKPSFSFPANATTVESAAYQKCLASTTGFTSVGVQAPSSPPNTVPTCQTSVKSQSAVAFNASGSSQCPTTSSRVRSKVRVPLAESLFDTFDSPAQGLLRAAELKGGLYVFYQRNPGAAQYGVCARTTGGDFKDPTCQIVDIKKGKPKGKYELFAAPVPDCFPVKKGFYSDSACTTRDVKKGKPKGKYERAANLVTGLVKGITLEIHGGPTVTCEAGSFFETLKRPKSGSIDGIGFVGCKAATNPCTTEGQASGTIETSPTYDAIYEEGGKIYTGITGAPLMTFTCGTEAFSVKGAVAGETTGDINTMSTSSQVVIGPGKGLQSLGATGPHGEATATLVATVSRSAAAPLQIDTQAVDEE
jgi:FG-GAP repeat